MPVVVTLLDKRVTSTGSPWFSKTNLSDVKEDHSVDWNSVVWSTSNNPTLVAPFIFQDKSIRCEGGPQDWSKLHRVGNLQYLIKGATSAGSTLSSKTNLSGEKEDHRVDWDSIGWLTYLIKCGAPFIFQDEFVRYVKEDHRVKELAEAPP